MTCYPRGSRHGIGTEASLADMVTYPSNLMGFTPRAQVASEAFNWGGQSAYAVVTIPDAGQSNASDKY